MFTITAHAAHNSTVPSIGDESAASGEMPSKLRTARGVLVGLALGGGAWLIIGTLIYFLLR